MRRALACAAAATIGATGCTDVVLPPALGLGAGTLVVPVSVTVVDEAGAPAITLADDGGGAFRGRIPHAAGVVQPDFLREPSVLLGALDAADDTTSGGVAAGGVLLRIPFEAVPAVHCEPCERTGERLDALAVVMAEALERHARRARAWVRPSARAPEVELELVGARAVCEAAAPDLSEPPTLDGWVIPIDRALRCTARVTFRRARSAPDATP